ncbi:MAG: hypothetical protein ACRDCT_21800, partial [Shewanella sp.]
SLNALKCKVMDITHSPTARHTDYQIGGQTLGYVATQRLLGVHFSKDLKWNHHTEIVHKKGAQILGFAQRNLKGCTPRVKRVAYQTMVKPILFYGTPAWHPESKGNVEKIEKIQRRALKFIHGKSAPAVDKKLMPVCKQLAYNDLLFFKKCETGAIDCNARERIIEQRVLRGSSANAHPKLQPMHPPRTKFAEHAFSFRVIGPWNRLPDPLKGCTAAQFPALCKAHAWQTANFDYNFNV